MESPYLLSGIIQCGMCGASMIGQGGNHHYRYYRCGNARRKGREVCPSPLLPKDKVEGVVTDQIKVHILTEENIEKLVQLTNEELAQTSREEKEKQEILEGQITDLESRLGKLYDALETREFQSGDLAPRIRALMQKREELHRTKSDIEERMRYKTVESIDPHTVRHYVSDLRTLLANSIVTEQRSFIKSFIEKIEVYDDKAKMY